MRAPSERARSVFLEAVEGHGPEQWPTFLDRACGDDAGLRAAVERLLRARAELGSFHEEDRPPLATAIDLTTAHGPGAAVGPYKLVELIGEGGMGTVFLAQQQAPVKRLVALKVIKAGMDSRQVLARFEAERQALALMDHPNIAKVLDAGAAPDGRPYFVMELIKGVPVTKYCDDRRLDPGDRLALFVQVCHAVQHAHQKGVIHRDLKPSNVLIAPYDGKPVVKVIDFGVAKAAGQPLTERTLVTGFGAVVGTPEYMSPEQAELNNQDIDTRSDVYSLGVLLYELLTGTTPLNRKRFNGTSLLEILRLVREEEPPKPSTRLSSTAELPAIAANRGLAPKRLNGLVRGELDWIVMKALEKDRARRYETASSFAADVQRYLADKPVLACPPSLTYLGRKFVRRHRGPVLAFSVVVLALVSGVIGTTWGMLRANAARSDAVRETEQKEQALDERTVALSHAREQLFQALVQRARAERSSGRIGQRSEALKLIRRAADMRITPELRTEAMAALVLPDVEVVHEWEAVAEDTLGLDFDAAFERYARLDRHGGITVRRRTDNGEEILARHTVQGKEPFLGPWLSPDGRYLAYGQGGRRESGAAEVRVCRLDASKVEELFVVPETMHLASLAYRLDRRQLAVGHANGWVSVYDLDSGERVRRMEIGAPPRHLAFHPRDGKLAVAAESAVRLFDVDTGKEMSALRHSPGVWVDSVAWHPDGLRLAAGCDDYKIHLWDTRTATEAMPPWVDGINGNVVAFNPTGDLLVSRGWGSQTRVWDAATGRLLMKLPGDFGVRFSSADARVLGFGVRDNKVRLSRVADGRELRVIRHRNTGSPDIISHPIPHTDGRTLAACGHRWLGFFDLVSGEELTSVPVPFGAARPVFFEKPVPAKGDGKSGPSNAEKPGGWITAGHSKVSLWPARFDSARSMVLRVGPPTTLATDSWGGYSTGTSASADGRIIAVPQGHSTLVVDRDQPDRRLKLGPQHDVRQCAVSPNGQWVVTCSHWQDGRSTSARIWETRSGKLVQELPLYDPTSARFSPDGRWLLTPTGHDSRLWEVGTWREVRRVNGCGPFSPDSRLLAINGAFGAISLVEVETGREVARLTGPEATVYAPLCFTPDGTRLIAQGSENTALLVWDLLLIRSQLKPLGLDWDWPEFSPAEPDREAPRSLQVEVLTGDLGRPTVTREQRTKQDIAWYRQKLDANPDDKAACNGLAWTYLIAPESLRDVKAALPLAEKAVRLAPDSADFANTLGVAYYRARRYREAIDVLRANLKRQVDPGLALDLYFLALSHHELGESARARDYYDWAVRWSHLQRQPSEEQEEELVVIRAEVEDRLGVKKK